MRAVRADGALLMAAFVLASRLRGEGEERRGEGEDKHGRREEQENRRVGSTGAAAEEKRGRRSRGEEHRIGKQEGEE